MQNTMFKKMGSTLFAIAAAALLSNCGAAVGDGGGGDGEALTLSGVLGGSSLLSREASAGLMSVDLSTLKMRCVTLSLPIQTGEGAVAADGAFSVEIPDGNGKKIGCFVLDADDDVVATMVVEDTAKTDISGSTKKETGVTLSGDANLGNVVIDFQKGTAVVDKTNIADKVEAPASTASVAWDMTGTWTISALSGATPKGYSDLCSASRDGDCNGPADGMPVYLKRVAGKGWDGTAATSEDKYGMMLWESKEAFDACGGTFGTTVTNLKGEGVDFSPSVVGTATISTAVAADKVREGAYIWANGDTDWVDGWKYASATTSYPIMDCGPVTVGGSAGWACEDGNTGNKRFDTTGGCTFGGAEFKMNDWNVMWDSCETTVSGNFFTNTCTEANYNHDSNSSTAAGTLVCSNTYAYLNSSNVVQTVAQIETATATACSGQTGNAGELTQCEESNFYNWDDVDSIAANTACSTLSNGSLEQARCYLSYFYQNEPSGCRPRINGDWSATTAADFIGEIWRAESEMGGNFIEYDSNGSVTFTQEDEYTEGVQAGNTYINCKVRESFALTLTPATKGSSVSKVLAEFNSESHLIDTEKPACVASFIDKGAVKKTLGSGTVLALRTKMLFNMTK